ncbi:MAG: NADH-quinone oxidoreductase subunit L [Planctomycetota bacterium]|nr:NADH-quinone oxidoreductase subunit L [Planctomycetota bacterium]
MLDPIFATILLATHGTSGGAFPIAHAMDNLGWAGLILWLPLISMLLCGVCAAMKVRSKAPAIITVILLALSFLVTFALFFNYESPVTIHLFAWFDIQWEGGGFVAPFSLYVDQLTLLWMLFVTGLGTLIALYASEYMEPDLGGGYARFFAGVSVFLFAMSSLVMGDNLVMLYLGWEGVGFASYWLIGYYYQKPSAVAAAKKAFIVNRIGDLGLALGLYLIYHYFGSIQFTEIFASIQHGVDPATAQKGGWTLAAIPFLLMLGAFGKSAQFPLFVWLPDAMEGPTPVSALIHAATMVTAGVYLLCRMAPLMSGLSCSALGIEEWPLFFGWTMPAIDALAMVAWVGGLTALLAATIGMAQYDIKRIMAYSTVSQLGYMFVGVGVLTTYGAAYHVFTHAFFKAVLFLTCGAIMHGFAGQLDLRKLSGLRHMKGWKVVSYTMLYGCLCLIGFPIISSGFYSKDLIMAQAFITQGPGFTALGVIMVITALLTAYYTFRVWFRVCAGEPHYEMGDEHHAPGDDHGGSDHDHHEPHPPGITINFVLIVISIGAVMTIFLGSWVKDMVNGSSAMMVDHHDDLADYWHKWMPYIASAAGLLGGGIAWWFHLANRKAADTVRSTLLSNPMIRWLPTAMENKWYVDEIYHALIRAPLWAGGHLLYLFDKYIVDFAFVDGIAKLPRLMAKAFQPLQNGVLQSYAVHMAGGVALVTVLIIGHAAFLHYWNLIVTFIVNIWASMFGGAA